MEPRSTITSDYQSAAQGVSPMWAACATCLWHRGHVRGIRVGKAGTWPAAMCSCAVLQGQAGPVAGPSVIFCCTAEVDIVLSGVSPPALAC